jgi:hypothetical protein
MDWVLYYQDLEKFNQKQREKHDCDKIKERLNEFKNDMNERLNELKNNTQCFFCEKYSENIILIIKSHKIEEIRDDFLLRFNENLFSYSNDVFLDNLDELAEIIEFLLEHEFVWKTENYPHEFELYEFIKNVIDNFENNRYSYVLK